MDSRIFCPDELLEKYAETGVNGIWMQAILYRMSEFPFEPSLSEGWQNRLKRLKEFSDRAMTYGIKLYLYINEPRAMSMEFFKKYPDLLGNKRDRYGCLCTSTKEVQQYLSDGIKAICKAVPELGGFFTITCSENITNCYSLKTEMTCPRCANRKAYEVIAEVNTIIADSVAEINPDIKVIAWDWVWQANKFMTADEVEKCIKLMPKNVILMANRDINLATNVGGIKGNVNDYSISVCGISNLAREEWKCAKAEGHETAARLQINNSWELSTIPYLPVFELLTESIEALSQEGIQHLSLSWTLGGYPAPNIKIVSELFFENSDKTVKTDIFRSLYGEFAEKVKEATDIFSDAFKEFPFDINGLYFGPQHGGVSNPLYLEKTGMEATMTCFAYDDLKKWRGIYPEDIYENQFKVLCEKWALGMKRLEDMPECELKDMAEGTYIQFKSSYNQIKFIRERDSKFDKKSMIEVLKGEKELAKKMLVIMKKNPGVGFEAANHYYYTQGMVREKILNCEYLIHMLKEKM